MARFDNDQINTVDVYDIIAAWLAAGIIFAGWLAVTVTMELFGFL